MPVTDQTRVREPEIVGLSRNYRLTEFFTKILIISEKHTGLCNCTASKMIFKIVVGSVSNLDWIRIRAGITHTRKEKLKKEKKYKF